MNEGSVAPADGRAARGRALIERPTTHLCERGGARADAFAANHARFNMLLMGASPRPILDLS